jgi:hypothetical protein
MRTMRAASAKRLLRMLPLGLLLAAGLVGLVLSQTG